MVGGDSDTEATWITFLLPYLEETALSGQIDWDAGFGHASVSGKNTLLVGQTLPGFVCPSGPRPEPALGGLYARGSYVANNGIGPMQDSWFPDLPLLRPVPGSTTSETSTSAAGVFFLNSDMRVGQAKSLMARAIRHLSQRFEPLKIPLIFAEYCTTQKVPTITTTTRPIV